MQSAGSRTFQKYFTTKKWDINFTSLKLIGYWAHLFKENKFGMKNIFFKKPKDVSLMLLIVGKYFIAEFLIFIFNYERSLFNIFRKK